MEDMGYRNTTAVYELNRRARLAWKRGRNVGTNSLAELVLLYMADRTYDWDSQRNEPPADAKAKQYPCRYYTLGWRQIASDLGMVLLTPEQAADEHAAESMRRREDTAKRQISDAWAFLRERGVLERLQPASLGRNAGWLLLLGDESENRAVERWARECLGLPGLA